MVWSANGIKRNELLTTIATAQTMAENAEQKRLFTEALQHSSVGTRTRSVRSSNTNATLVVVEVVQKGTKQVEDKYRLACAFLGQLRPSILSPILSGEYASETYSGGSARRGRARAVPPLCTE